MWALYNIAFCFQLIKELQLFKNGNSAKFFEYVCNSKRNRELFASTINRIVARVRCVSSTTVVLNAKLLD